MQDPDALTKALNKLRCSKNRLEETNNAHSKWLQEEIWRLHDDLKKKTEECKSLSEELERTKDTLANQIDQGHLQLTELQMKIARLEEEKLGSVKEELSKGLTSKEDRRETPTTTRVKEMGSPRSPLSPKSRNVRSRGGGGVSVSVSVPSASGALKDPSSDLKEINSAREEAINGFLKKARDVNYIEPIDLLRDLRAQLWSPKLVSYGCPKCTFEDREVVKAIDHYVVVHFKINGTGNQEPFVCKTCDKTSTIKNRPDSKIRYDKFGELVAHGCASHKSIKCTWVKPLLDEIAKNPEEWQTS